MTEPTNPFMELLKPGQAAPGPAAPPQVNAAAPPQVNAAENPFAAIMAGKAPPASPPPEAQPDAPPPETPSPHPLADLPGEMVSNLWPSFKRKATDIYDAATEHPLGFVKSVVTDSPFSPMGLIKYNKDFIQGAIKKYGSWEKAKETAATDPATFLTDIASFIPGVGGSGRVLNTLEKVADTVSGLADPARIAGATADTIGGAAKFLGKSADAVVQTAEGIGPGALAKMVESGEKITPDVWKTMTHGLDVNAAYDKLVEAAGSLKKQRSDNYIAGMRDVAGADKPVDFDLVDKAVKDSIGVTHYKPEGTPSHDPGILVRRGPAAEAQNEAIKLIDEWKMRGPDYHTALGFDSMKKSLYDMAEGLEGQYGMATPASTAVGKIADAVRNTINDAVPEYGTVMKKWGADTDQLKSYMREFSLGNPAQKFAAIRKFQKVYRQSADVAHGERTNMLQDIMDKAGDPDLMSKLAADQFNPTAPRGIRGSMLPGLAGHAILSGGLELLPAMGAVMSPRVTGAAAYGLGRGMGIANRAGVPQAAQALKQGVIPSVVRAQNNQSDVPQQRRGGYFSRSR